MGLPAYQIPAKHHRHTVLRPAGTPHGVYVDQKVSCQNAVALCASCYHKFDYKRHHYIPAKRWGRMIGTCDGCREHTNDQTLFIHESSVAGPNGKVMSGTVYTPK